MDAVELDRPERLRAWLARQRTVHEVRADGQGGWHWQALAADDAAPFDPPSVLPPFSAKGFFFAERERLFWKWTHGGSRDGWPAAFGEAFERIGLRREAFNRWAR